MCVSPAWHKIHPLVSQDLLSRKWTCVKFVFPRSPNFQFMICNVPESACLYIPYVCHAEWSVDNFLILPHSPYLWHVSHTKVDYFLTLQPWVPTCLTLRVHMGSTLLYLSTNKRICLCMFLWPMCRKRPEWIDCLSRQRSVRLEGQYKLTLKFSKNTHQYNNITCNYNLWNLKYIV